MKTCVLIVGGGLSGLSLALKLHRAGLDFQLIEARNRFGGRIHGTAQAQAHFDLGPAWFWPGQPLMAHLTSELGLRVFDQFAEGAQLYEDETGQLHHGRGFASMAGSIRVEGGFAAMVQSLVNSLPGARLHLSSELVQLAKTQENATATLKTGAEINAEQVVLALPPRIVAKLAFFPELPRETTTQLTNTPTWMAGQAKAVVTYNSPFWRNANLSGDAMSRIGPMAEVHDASPPSGKPGALFGFIGVQPQVRSNRSDLKKAILGQLARFFGKEASTPDSLTLQDWAIEPFTATLNDSEPLYTHPNYGPVVIKDPVWKDRLHFAGSEVDREFGGYLEGALNAAETVAAKLMK